MSSKNQIIKNFPSIVEADAQGTITGLTVANANIANITSTGVSNLGDVANVKITGGTAGQVLGTTGNGGLFWSTGSGLNISAITNGGSNVSIPNSDGDIEVNVGANQWLFNTAGNLRFPDGTFQNTAYTGGGGGLPIANGNSNINIATADGNVTVTVNGASTWTFDGGGNLALPGGGIVYGNPFTPSGAPGNTITLQPAGSGAITDQRLLIYPTAADGDHIHMTTGNLYQTELFLGSDNFYAKLSNTGNFVVQANDGVGNIAQYTFSSDGNLTLPGNLLISGQTSLLGTNAALLQSTDDLPLVSLSTNANGSVSSIWLENYADIPNSNIAAIYTPLPGTGTVRILTGNNGANVYFWDFTNTGNLTLPGNTFAVNYANGSPVTLGGLPLANGTSNINIPVANGNITMAVGGAGDRVVISSGSANFAGNIDSLGFGRFSGNVTAANFTGNVANGNSAISIPAANGNINISAAGGAAEIIVTSTGANVTGYLNATGNVRAGGGFVTGPAVLRVGNGSATVYLEGSTQTWLGTDSGTVYSNANVELYGNFRAVGPVDYDFIPRYDPANGVVIDLGSNSNRWGELWLTNSTVHIGNAAISANATALIFTNPEGGSLVFDGNANIDTSQISNGNSNVSVAANSNVTVSVAGTKTWTFDDTGNFNIPGSILVSTAASPAPSINGFSTINTIDGANLNGFVFGSGNLTLPANSFAIKYANGAQASAPLVDVLNTNGLTTVFYPTFTEDRANGQTLRGDVDLTYRTDTNTLTVGVIAANSVALNNNTVVLGSLSGESNVGQNAVAIGSGAGRTNQADGAVAIGQGAGNLNQGGDSIAIGYQAGQSNQAAATIAIGYRAGRTDQKQNSTAVGFGAGATNQGLQATAVGADAGSLNQSNRAIAIGVSAGQLDQGVDSVALGSYAGRTNQANNSIVINGTSGNLENTVANSLVIKPIRNLAGSVPLYYNSTSGEITYSDAGNANVLSLTATGTISVTGNANVGNLGTAGQIIVTGNITSTGGDLVAQEWSAANTANVANFFSNGGLNIYATAGFNVFGAGIVSNGVVNSTGNMTASNAAVVARRFINSANGIVNSGSGTNLTLDWTVGLQYFTPTNATNVQVNAPPVAGLTVCLVLRMPSSSYNIAINGINANQTSSGSTSFAPGVNKATHLIFRSFGTATTDVFCQIDSTA